jgi:hypothetical protein
VPPGRAAVVLLGSGSYGLDWRTAYRGSRSYWVVEDARKRRGLQADRSRLGDQFRRFVSRHSPKVPPGQTMKDVLRLGVEAWVIVKDLASTRRGAERVEAAAVAARRSRRSGDLGRGHAPGDRDLRAAGVAVIPRRRARTSGESVVMTAMPTDYGLFERRSSGTISRAGCYKLKDGCNSDACLDVVRITSSFNAAGLTAAAV